MENLISMTSNHFDNLYNGQLIAKKFAGWAAEYDISAPYVTYPFGSFTSKATAIQNNLFSFNEEQQFFIIKEMCDEQLKHRDSDKEASKILHLLMKKFGELYSDDQLDRNIISETKSWLSPYKKAIDEYDKAMDSYDSGKYDRHALDSIRLSLELFLQDILKNSKSLENQLIPQELLPLLAKSGIPKEIRNMIFHIFQGLSVYQNENVKHGVSFTDLEVEFVIEQTSILMKIIAKSIKG